MKNKLTKKVLEGRQKRGEEVVKILKKLFPKVEMTLNYSNNWELLVAVILSAQCTDKKVNEVTKKLFKKYKKLDDYVEANLKEFEKDIHSTGFYHSKAKNILASAKIIKEKYGGEVPRTMTEMLVLAGVGRKTANVVLGAAYGIVDGIAVDTHVIRLSKLFGLTTAKTPVKIEQELMEVLPRSEWGSFTHRMIAYGRKYCPAHKHDNKNCPIAH